MLIKQISKKKVYWVDVRKQFHQFPLTSALTLPTSIPPGVINSPWLQPGDQSGDQSGDQEIKCSNAFSREMPREAFTSTCPDRIGFLSK